MKSFSWRSRYAIAHIYFWWVSESLWPVDALTHSVMLNFISHSRASTRTVFFQRQDSWEERLLKGQWVKSALVCLSFWTVGGIQTARPPSGDLQPLLIGEVNLSLSRALLFWEFRDFLCHHLPECVLGLR